MKAILLGALVTLAASPFIIAGNPAAAPPRATPMTSPPAASLGFIETRDRSIEIKAGETGSYTVRTKEGKILAENISTSQLQARFPELDQILRSGYARNTEAGLSLNPSAKRIVHFGSAGATTSVFRSATWNTDASVNVMRRVTWNNDARVS